MEKFYISNLCFQIWWLIRAIKVMKNTQFQLNMSKIWLLPQKTQAHGL